MNVHATVFNPLAEHEPYMVVASALPPGAHPQRAFPIRSTTAATLEEAISKCCELAREVRELSEQLGHRVQGMRCSHCPTPHAPACGAHATPGDGTKDPARPG